MSGANLLVLGGTQAAAPAVYIEDVFSTYLYTGTGATQTITNGIDLSTKGGLVWTKSRSNAYDHGLTDTSRGNDKVIFSNLTNGNSTTTNCITSFNTTGFTLGTDATLGVANNNTYTYASWTFREQPKFFDIVTYTGNGSNRTISHNLGSVPGSIFIKRTDTTGAWAVYHRSLANTEYLVLNTTAAKATGTTYWNSTTPTSTEFSLGTATDVNANSGTYVAYLFAHDAGGFGLTGSDNVISCGSFSGSVSVNLGWEAQWVLIKDAGNVGQWYLFDNMRGMAETEGQSLSPNTSGAESNVGAFIVPTATGFKNVGGGNYIYIAIRRGPMKTPTSGTSVFAVTSFTGVDAAQTSNFPVDFVMNSENLTGTVGWFWVDRLRGPTKKLESNATNAEGSVTSGVWDSNTTVKISGSGNNYKRSYPMFRRAPGFFDVVCYTGTGSNTTISHNLGVAPELIICKSRSSNPGANWVVWHQTLNSSTGYLYLNSTLEASTFSGVWNGAPTSTYFTLGTNYQNNNSGTTFVAYLFASVSGVSKVGSYTGTGTTLQVNCGFTNGSSFVLIKRTDSTGDWYVWDSARGIVAGNDPYLLLNSSAAEVTNTDYVDTYSAGFELSSTAPAGLNANGGSYIFLAIA